MAHHNTYELGVRKMAVDQFAQAVGRLDLARLGRHPDVMPAGRGLGKDEQIAVTTALLVETGEMARAGNVNGKIKIPIFGKIELPSSLVLSGYFLLFRLAEGGEHTGLALFAQTGTLATDIERDGMVQEPVENGRGQYLPGKDVAPLTK